MKGKKKNVICMAILVLILCVFVSCNTTKRLVGYAYPIEGNMINATIIPKDYEPRGIIFIESHEYISKYGYRGSKITYDMIMREADKLDAHDVINIRIDVSTNILRDRRYINGGYKNVRETQNKYTAVGLAIRYINEDS